MSQSHDNINDDVEFGDQFNNLGETPTNPDSKNESEKMDDDVEFGDQFADLGEGPAGGLAESLLINDIVNIGEEETSKGLDGSVNKQNFDSNFDSNFVNAPKDPFLSVAREGGFGTQFINFGAKPTSGPKNSRESFKVQLQGLDAVDLDLIDINEGTESTSSSISGTRASMTIDDRMRKSSIGKNMTKLLGLTELESLIDGDEKEAEAKGEKAQYEDYIMDPVFTSQFAPEEMRCLALVAHNHMKPAMKEFVLSNQNLLRKFKLTGTNTTMTMLRGVFGDDPSVKYGPTCTSGPLGGDAELVAIMCTENLGGCVFFQDPMSSHPHSADIECLTRQANVHNILMMPNPATAYACMASMRTALKEGKAEMIPSFFKTLASPSVAEYKVRQAKVVERNRGK